jgi:hypothetical protein
MDATHDRQSVFCCHKVLQTVTWIAASIDLVFSNLPTSHLISSSTQRDSVLNNWMNVVRWLFCPVPTPLQIRNDFANGVRVTVSTNDNVSAMLVERLTMEKLVRGRWQTNVVSLCPCTAFDAFPSVAVLPLPQSSWDDNGVEPGQGSGNCWWVDHTPATDHCFCFFARFWQTLDKKRTKPNFVDVIPLVDFTATKARILASRACFCWMRCLKGRLKLFKGQLGQPHPVASSEIPFRTRQ